MSNSSTQLNWNSPVVEPPPAPVVESPPAPVVLASPPAPVVLASVVVALDPPAPPVVDRAVELPEVVPLLPKPVGPSVVPELPLAVLGPALLVTVSLVVTLPAVVLMPGAPLALAAVALAVMVLPAGVCPARSSSRAQATAHGQPVSTTTHAALIRTSLPRVAIHFDPVVFGARG